MILCPKDCRHMTFTRFSGVFWCRLWTVELKVTKHDNSICKQLGVTRLIRNDKCASHKTFVV